MRDSTWAAVSGMAGVVARHCGASQPLAEVAHSAPTRANRRLPSKDTPLCSEGACE